MFKVLLFLGLAVASAQAGASGCDCSCFGVKEKILRQDVHDSYHFRLERDGTNIKLIPIPGLYNRVLEPVTLSGYKNRFPIHPKLVDRIVTEKPRFHLRRYNMHLMIENDWCSVDVAEADTGRMVMQIEFDTGEEVTLWHPSDDELFDPETGSIQTDKLLPFPLKDQVKP